jgi:hypothetical protein
VEVASHRVGGQPTTIADARAYSATIRLTRSAVARTSVTPETECPALDRCPQFAGVSSSTGSRVTRGLTAGAESIPKPYKDAPSMFVVPRALPRLDRRRVRSPDRSIFLVKSPGSFPFVLLRQPVALSAMYHGLTTLWRKDRRLTPLLTTAAGTTPRTLTLRLSGLRDLISFQTAPSPRRPGGSRSVPGPIRIGPSAVVTRRW